MEAPEPFRFLIILALSILFSGLWFLVWKWPQGKDMSLSQHAAAYRHAYFYYIGLFLVVLPLLMIFFIRWFVPEFHLYLWFTYFIALSAAAQFIVVLIPESGGKKTTYHRFFAAGSALMLIPSLVIISRSEAISSISRSVSIISLIFMVTIICVLIAGRGKHAYLLVLQVAYFALFFLAILSATFLQ